MPDSSRSSVDLPAPLCPTRPTRAPCSMSTEMSRSAWMTGILASLEMLPPTMPSTVFFSDRLLASKIGKSTHASRVVMLTTNSAFLCARAGPSDPVGHAGAVTPHDHEGQGPPDDRDREDDDPVSQVL